MQIAPIQASSTLDLAKNARAGQGASSQSKHTAPEGFPYGNAIQVIEATARAVSNSVPAAKPAGTNLDVKI